MRKNGRTLWEDIVLVVRGIKEFNHILPGQMWLVLLRSILNSMIPYIAVIMSAFILNELTGGQNRERLLGYVGISVGLTCLCSALKYFLDAQIAVGYSHLFNAHEIYLTDKSYRLPYEMLERSDIRSLREQVSGSISVSGAGMASLYWDMDVVFTNVCSAVIGFVLCVDFLKEVVLWNTASAVGIESTIGIVLLFVALVTVCSYVSCKMTSKRFDVGFEVFENGAKYNRYGEFYTLNYLQEEDAALDVRIFNQQKMIILESQKQCYEPFAEGKEKEFRAVNKYDGAKLLCSGLCGVVVYILVGQKALQGAIGVGSIVMTYAAVTMLIFALSELAQIITDLRNNNNHLTRFFQYMDLPEEEAVTLTTDAPLESVITAAPVQKGTATGRDFRESQGLCNETMVEMKSFRTLTFEHVSFKYPESSIWVLKDINLTVTAGEKLAIVGENGSGKTTLIKLLCRLYQPTEGRILIDDKDIWSLTYKEYIKLISTVFQDFALFAFSLAENVAATKEYDEERVVSALTKAGLGTKLQKLPRGIQQHLFHDFEEDGMDLSGGEAQKIAIARAIYKDAPIMILDEPTAALDPYAEYDIYKNFHDITRDKTVLSISHRLSSCRMCDKVVVMDAGRIVQYGTHQELVRQEDNKYYGMWQAQAQYYM